jgi:hypothetical protein
MNEAVRGGIGISPEAGLTVEERMVGAGRFELRTPGPPDRCANRAALRSDALSGLPWIIFTVRPSTQAMSRLDRAIPWPEHDSGTGLELIEKRPELLRVYPAAFLDGVAARLQTRFARLCGQRAE